MGMFVFKFGGASVKSAEAVRNIVEILRRHKEDEIVVVVPTDHQNIGDVLAVRVFGEYVVFDNVRLYAEPFPPVGTRTDSNAQRTNSIYLYDYEQ